MIAFFAAGCLFALAWSSNQAAVPPPAELVEPDGRPLGAEVAILLVASDGSPVADAIDRASGRLGYSHVAIDAGHPTAILDYRPGAGVHWAPRDRYAERAQARVVLTGRTGEQLFGCARSRLGQPFDAAGLLLHTTSLANCCGLVVGCLPPAIYGELGGSGRPIAPNDLARLFGAQLGATVRWGEE